MPVQLEIPYETVFELVKQLPKDEKAALLDYLLKEKEHRSLSAAERLKVFQSLSKDVGGILEGYSDRREDWYGDDGR